MSDTFLRILRTVDVYCTFVRNSAATWIKVLRIHYSSYLRRSFAIATVKC